MNKFEERTMKKKSAIVESSLKLFSKDGFNAVSVKDIALSANVSQVSIYNYFGSKESLVKECAIIVMQETAKLAKDILHTDLTFNDKLMQALSMCNRQINISLNHYFSEIALQDKVLFNLLSDNIKTLKNSIYADYIECGKRENAIDSTISTSTILAFIDGINSIGMGVPQDEIHKLFLYGLIGKPN